MTKSPRVLSKPYVYRPYASLPKRKGPTLQEVRLDDLESLSNPKHTSRVDISDGEYLSIDGSYHIEKARLNTPAKIVGWIAHLENKNWFATDAQLILDFINAAKALTKQKTEWS